MMTFLYQQDPSDEFYMVEGQIFPMWPIHTRKLRVDHHDIWRQTGNILALFLSSIFKALTKKKNRNEENMIKIGDESFVEIFFDIFQFVDIYHSKN